MQDIKRLESTYLRAKIEYYEGNEIMTDAAFDKLEKTLKEAGSKVPDQVGAKRKDFDFEHPTPMLSLAKQQTEEVDGVTNYVEVEFKTWFEKRFKQLTKNGKSILHVPAYLPLTASPKFDGNAINIVLNGNKIFQTLTRGDGKAGKNITKRFEKTLGTELVLDGLDVTEEDTIEIRCEVVIKKSIFNEKYKGSREDGKFANPRNYVAGVIGKDDYDEVKVSELTIVPLQFLLNGKFIGWKHFKKNEFCKKNWDTPFVAFDYLSVIKEYEKSREDNEFLLDGMVIALPIRVREELGQNEHDPEWAIAIKFVPEEVITTVNGIEWNIGKRGQFTPVILLDTVQLAGTNVRRASGYNAGYVKDNGIGAGAIVSVAKAGDIIPEIQKVEIKADKDIELPTECPECKSTLSFDGIHLLCPNQLCPGRVSKILSTGAAILDLKGIGSERLKPFSYDFGNMYELMIYVLDCPDNLEKYGFVKGTRLHEIFVKSFQNIKSIPYDKVVQLLGYENVGRKITKQLALEHAGMEFSYASLEKALVKKLHTKEVESYIKEAVSTLESLGVIVDRPEAPNTDGIGVVMTGKTTAFGFKTKKEFLAKHPQLFECSMSDATCKYLVTDDLSSTSGKMKAANKKGIEIKTYGDF